MNNFILNDGTPANGYSPSPKDLTTVADVMSYLDIKPPVDTALAAAQAQLIQRLVTSSSVFIQTHLNRDLAAGIVVLTENRNGNGNQIMPFYDFPVSSVGSVSINDQSIPESISATDSGFTFSGTALYLRGCYRFVKGVRNIQFSYSAGYATVPEDVSQVCVSLCSRWYKDRQRVGISSKGMGTENIVFTKTDLTDEFKSLLRQYQKTVPI